MKLVNLSSRGYFFRIVPTIGISLFFAFFIYSASIYPGGSQANLNSKGYSWINNYWCELMNNESMNGMENPAMPYAVTGMVCLSIGLSSFFFQLPSICPTGKFKQRIVQICGITGTIFAALLFTDFHDLMLLGFSVFTLITVIVALMILYENGRKWQFWAGVLGISLVQTVNFMYYLRVGIKYLPVVQKFTIAFVLVWILVMNLCFTSSTLKEH